MIVLNCFPNSYGDLSGFILSSNIEETERMIWLSAFANNNPRSDYHWRCDACYDITYY